MIYSLNQLSRRWILLITLLFLAPIGILAQTKVACVGNSITYGYGISNRDSLSYPAQLQRMLGKDYIVGNFGKSGATLLNRGHRPYTQQKEYQEALRFAGDIVIIHLGINDTDPRNWPNYQDEFIRDYTTLIKSFRSANPHARILIARLTPISDRHPRFLSGTRDWHEEIQKHIERVATINNVELFDLHEPLYHYPHLLPDGLHPNEDGATILAQTVYSAITGNWGGLQMPAIYSDNMVLQGGQPLRIKGRANAMEEVRIRLDKQEQKTKADRLGYWQVTLPALKASFTPHELTISSPTRSLSYHNVLIGDVWLCSGQSNMEFMVKQSSSISDTALMQDPSLRLYNMQAQWHTDAIEWSLSALDSINKLHHYRPTAWQPTTPAQAKEFSAVAYHFGKMLRDSLNIPIGLICNAVGGSTTESWIDRHTLEFQFPEILHDWSKNDFVMPWVRSRAQQNIKQSSNPLQRHPYQPAYLFEAGILPLNAYPIKGVIWYQGESNAHNIEVYQRLMPLLIDSWRTYFEAPQLPFIFVQLSSINRPSWPAFREAQRQISLQIPNTAMAVSSDLGDPTDVHPKVKKPVGERLALQALSQVYHHQKLIPSGPIPLKATIKGDKVWLSLKYADGLQTSDQKPIASFELAEYEGYYFPATAVLRKGGLEISSPEVKHPRYLRYGWQPYSLGNLINSQGLPASTFRLKIK